MMRTSTKRKSEGALPPAKHQKGEQSFSMSPLSEQERSSGSLFIKDTPAVAKHVKKRTRQSEPAPKSRVDDEYEEDVGRTESQSFLALVEFESKKKRKATKEKGAYIERWEKSVDDTAAKLKLALGNGYEKSNQRNVHFLESFKSTYSASCVSVTMPDQAKGQHTSSFPNFAALYKKGKVITSTASALVAKFEEVSQRIESIDTATLIENEWGEQDACMMALLQEAKQIGIGKYRRVLMLAKNSKEENSEGGDAGDEKLFFDREEKIEGLWGEVAKKQVKVMKKLVQIVEVSSSA